MNKLTLAALGLIGFAVVSANIAYAQTVNEPVGRTSPKEGAMRIWSRPAPFEPCPDGVGIEVKKCASWEADVDFHAGHCRLRSPAVTVFADGKVEWSAQVRSDSTGDRYGVSLHFQDDHVWVWIMDPIWTDDLFFNFNPWNRRDLAMARHLYATLKSVSRWDQC